MKILMALTAVMALAFFTNPHAVAKGKKQQPNAQKSEDQAKNKAIDEAYKNALKIIPASNAKPDPWKSVR